MDRPLIQCIGWHGKGNFGDDIFSEVLRLAWSNFDLIFSDGSIAPQARAVVFAGGDIVTPYFARELAQRRLPVFMIGVGLRTPRELPLLSELEDLRLTIFRNGADAKLAAGAGLRAFSAPDLAFARFEERLIEPPAVTLPNKLLIILNDELNSRARVGGRNAVAFRAAATFMSEMLAKAASRWEESWWTVWPCFADGPLRDDFMVYDITRSMQPPMYTYEAPRLTSIQTARAVFSDARAVVTMRFHGAVLATMFARPFVCVSLGRKYDLFMKENNLDDLLVPSNNMDQDLLEETAERVLRDTEVRERLATIAKHNKQGADNALSLMEKEILKAV